MKNCSVYGGEQASKQAIREIGWTRVNVNIGPLETKCIEDQATSNKHDVLLSLIECSAGVLAIVQCLIFLRVQSVAVRFVEHLVATDAALLFLRRDHWEGSLGDRSLAPWLTPVPERRRTLVMNPQRQKRMKPRAPLLLC